MSTNDEVGTILLAIAAMAGMVMFCVTIMRWIGRGILRVFDMHEPVQKQGRGDT